MKEHHHQQRRALNTEGNPDWYEVQLACLFDLFTFEVTP